MDRGLSEVTPPGGEPLATLTNRIRRALSARAETESGQLILDAVIDAISHQVETLTIAGKVDDLSDLYVLLSLIASDILGDNEEAARYLGLAGVHPLAPWLHLSAAIARGDAAALEGCEARLPALADARERHTLAVEVAGSWLFRLGDPARAVSVLLGSWQDFPARVNTALIALALSPDRELIGQIAADRTGDVEVIGDLVALLLDRLNDPKAALELARRELDHQRRLTGPTPELPLMRLIELAIEAALVSGAGELPELLEVRAEWAAADTLALDTQKIYRYLAAVERMRRGGDSEALFSLTSPEGEGDLNGNATVEVLIALHRALSIGDRLQAAWARRQLANGPGRYALIHGWRAVELSAAGGEHAGVLDGASMVAIAHKGAGTARLVARLALEAGDHGRLRAALRDAQLTGAAVAVAESRLGDPEAAVNDCELAIARDPHDLAARHHLARLLRASRAAPRLAPLYRELAELSREQRAQTALFSAAGVIDLSFGALADAEAELSRAAASAPRDIASRTALVSLHHRAERWPELVSILEELVPLTADAATRVRWSRQGADIAITQLGDPARAAALLEVALGGAPDDASLMLDLAGLCARAGHDERAQQLRRRAAALVGEERRGRILLDLAASDEAAGNAETALAAYLRALEIDQRDPIALEGAQRIWRASGDRGRLLASLRFQLAEEADPSRRAELAYEIGSLCQASGDTDAAMTGYLQAASADPGHRGAQEHLFELATSTGRWSEIAKVYREAAPTAENLAVLIQALEEGGEYTEVARLRAIQLERTEDVADRVAFAMRLAEFCEKKLGDLDQAIRLREQAQRSGVAPPDNAHQLTRLYGDAGRWSDVSTAIEEELKTIPPGDAREVELLLRAGEVRRDRLDRPGEAVLAYEAALARAPKNENALEALDQLYHRLGRDQEQLRALRARADAAAEPDARAGLRRRIAELLRDRGDVEGAFAAYDDAWTADPSDRDLFTAIEELCFKHERWPTLMHLYETAIAAVESGASKSFRLRDLYSRRGQVELQNLGDRDRAAISYRKVVELDPDDDTAVHVLETIALDRRDWRGAATLHLDRAQLAHDHGRRLDSLRRAARLVSEKLGDQAEAARIYQQILALEPSDDEALDVVERDTSSRQAWPQLLVVLRGRLAAAPAGDEAVTLLGRMAQIFEEHLRDEEQAISHYQRILEIAPANAAALEALGRIYEATERWTELADVTSRQIRVTSDRVHKALLYFKSGSVAEAKFGDEAEAIRYYEAAIKTSSSCMPAIHGLRDIHARRNEWRQVIETLELEANVWQEPKDRAGVVAQIARIYGEKLGQADRAAKGFQQALDLDPECLPANLAMLEHHIAEGRWETARRMSQLIVHKMAREADPALRNEFFRRSGVVAARLGDARAAVDHFLIALEIRPLDQEAFDELAALAVSHPGAHDFVTTFNDLERLYRQREDGGPLLARTLAARGRHLEDAGDLDAAEALYAEAQALQPDNVVVAFAQVDLCCRIRRFTAATDVLAALLRRPISGPHRLSALLRLAEIHSDFELEPQRSITVLREVVRFAPKHIEAHYRLAQDCFQLRRFSEAREAIDRAIDLAASPGRPLSATELARYYCYKGQILEAAGDNRGAALQYHRARDYDPGLVAATSALARRALDGGDPKQAEQLLIEGAHRAIAERGLPGAIPMQRQLARVLVSERDSSSAIEAYRGILNVAVDDDDQLALAELYAIDDAPRAVIEVRRILDRTVDYAPAFRMLATLYAKAGAADRMARVVAVIEQLGYFEDSEQDEIDKVKARAAAAPLERGIDDLKRRELLPAPASRGPHTDLLRALGPELERWFPALTTGASRPMSAADDLRVMHHARHLMRLWGVTADVSLASTPGALVSFATRPKPTILVDPQLLQEPDAAQRFALGTALEAIHEGFGFLLALTDAQRREIGRLIAGLPDATRDASEMTMALRRAAGPRLKGLPELTDPDQWIDELMRSARRGGLLAADDVGAAIHVLSLESGARPGTPGLAKHLLGASLVRFYLSDSFHRVRLQLATPKISAINV